MTMKAKGQLPLEACKNEYLVLSDPLRGAGIEAPTLDEPHYSLGHTQGCITLYYSHFFMVWGLSSGV